MCAWTCWFHQNIHVELNETEHRVEDLWRDATHNVLTLIFWQCIRAFADTKHNIQNKTQTKAKSEIHTILNYFELSQTVVFALHADHPIEKRFSTLRIKNQKYAHKFTGKPDLFCIRNCLSHTCTTYNGLWDFKMLRIHYDITSQQRKRCVFFFVVCRYRVYEKRCWWDAKARTKRQWKYSRSTRRERKKER